MILRCALALLLAASSAAAAAPALTGFLSGRSVYATGQRSWLEGGFGRLDFGADSRPEDATLVAADAHVGVDWEVAPWLALHASGVARAEPSGYGGERAGLVEAFADVRYRELRLRGGYFFLPTSRENVGDLWASPYTISFSALNNWIGQEVRPVGADLQWRHETAAGHVVTVAGTAFRDNDTMGTLLAWRGWTVGDRLTVYNEVLPLPPLRGLREIFVNQRDDGTVPFERDLDGETGVSARVRWSLPERATIQYTYVDNRADRLLYRGEYAWATSFHLVGGEIGHVDRTILVAEAMTGTTGMGVEPRPYVDADFHAGYTLISHKRGRTRFSARYDWFATRDIDDGPDDTNDEDGRSWTLATFFDVTPHVRTGLEFTQITGNRPAAAEAGFDPNTDGRTLTFEVRYRF